MILSIQKADECSFVKEFFRNFSWNSLKPWNGQESSVNRQIISKCSFKDVDLIYQREGMIIYDINFLNGIIICY